MSLSDFCNASYALLAEQHQRIDPLKGLLEVARAIEPEAPEGRSVVKTSTAAQNDASIAMLAGAMKNVRKPRRR